MIRSMTGFGEGEREMATGTLRVEIRTVNHRFLNPQLRLPLGYERHEGEILARLRPRLNRGHVKLTVILERPASTSASMVEVDLDRALGYRDALLRLKAGTEVPGEVDLALLTRFSEIFRGKGEGEVRAVEVDLPLLLEVVDEAVSGVVAMRIAEGARLHADLVERLGKLALALDEIETRAPLRLIAERDRLRNAVRELAEGVGVDEERLAREIAHLAERWDISEEIVRFRAHLEAFREALELEGEVVGKRLGFLIQELNREANTIGSKANDAGIAAGSMRLKEEIERIREQLENIE